ncbi:TetR/AcrR family transcriptional regulator [Kaistia dalseonensis]|uniref:AcrR family transcriptional regulator n=1 Tax=Kaistia dalseonensis TaxID=410840 RepID=A0ABU0H9X3_9HYPH|nr:TetR/AcrR family transcriptional regulator [Kaistia dalseonensis]MCX5496475.1 TetR/AcrR family transcriptional regulator [Kaistia dalseonensis]MDQ0439097.1 AcrR family transcriptional regulator [Kaistia dalseonensis]
MATVPPAHLTPRKRPRQARATVTVDAIFEATIQVLLADGPNRLTTTRVAQRAGVSVGTMYQYFPHKQALLYALNERYLEIVAEKVERACEAQHGASIGQMVDALVGAYWEAKTVRSDVTRALYRSAVELDTESLIEAFGRRVDAATAAMLASAADADFADPSVVNTTLLTAIFGAVRSVFERNLPSALGGEVRGQLVVMCRSYLEAVKKEPERAAPGGPATANRTVIDDAG